MDIFEKLLIFKIQKYKVKFSDGTSKVEDEPLMFPDLKELVNSMDLKWINPKANQQKATREVFIANIT